MESGHRSSCVKCGALKQYRRIYDPRRLVQRDVVSLLERPQDVLRLRRHRTGECVGDRTEDEPQARRALGRRARPRAAPLGCAPDRHEERRPRSRSERSRTPCRDESAEVQERPSFVGRPSSE
jgi:hypothetical protein